eukprot:g3017.t1
MFRSNILRKMRFKPVARPSGARFLTSSTVAGSRNSRAVMTTAAFCLASGAVTSYMLNENGMPMVPFLATTRCDLFGGSSSTPHVGVYGTKQERTFLAIKPDGVQRQLVGEIIKRFEQRGYRLVGLKMVTPTLKMAQEHYIDLKEKPFYPGLTKYFSSGPIVCMCWEGKDVIKQGRRMLGETNPLASPPGSIRGDYCIALGRNIIHGSDGQDSAAHELTFWFKPEELNNTTYANEAWVYEPGRD